MDRRAQGQWARSPLDLAREQRNDYLYALLLQAGGESLGGTLQEQRDATFLG